MHPLSRNKQKPITVNPKGSLQWRKPRKAERKLNTSAFICSLCLAFQDHIFLAQFRFFHAQVGRKDFCPQHMIDALKCMKFYWRRVCSFQGHSRKHTKEALILCSPTPPSLSITQQGESLGDVEQVRGLRGRCSSPTPTLWPLQPPAVLFLGLLPLRAILRPSCALLCHKGADLCGVFSRLLWPWFCYQGWFSSFDHLANITMRLLSLLCLIIYKRKFFSFFVWLLAGGKLDVGGSHLPLSSRRLGSIVSRGSTSRAWWLSGVPAFTRTPSSGSGNVSFILCPSTQSFLLC